MSHQNGPSGGSFWSRSGTRSGEKSPERPFWSLVARSGFGWHLIERPHCAPRFKAGAMGMQSFTNCALPPNPPPPLPVQPFALYKGVNPHSDPHKRHVALVCLQLVDVSTAPDGCVFPPRPVGARHKPRVTPPPQPLTKHVSPKPAFPGCILFLPKRSCLKPPKAVCIGLHPFVHVSSFSIRKHGGGRGGRGGGGIKS